MYEEELKLQMNAYASLSWHQLVRIC